MLSQPKSAVHKQAARLFQQHCRDLKRIVYLNSAFEKADRVQEQKRTGSQLWQKWAANIIKPMRTRICQKK
jgi:hypothetical protein